MSLEKLKAEAVKLRQNIDAVYEAGMAAGGGDSYYDAFWDDFQQNGTRTDYKYAFSGTGWTAETLKPKYTIRIVDTSSITRGALGMFNYLAWNTRGKIVDMTEICKKIDMSQALSAQYMFQMAFVENVTLDLSNVTTMYGIFAGNDGGHKNHITLTVSDKCTVYTNAFHKVDMLTHLTFTEGSVIGADISFVNSSLLSGESVQSIINALQDRTGLTALTVTFHIDVKNKLTEEQQLQILSKNWTLG